MHGESSVMYDAVCGSRVKSFRQLSEAEGYAQEMARTQGRPAQVEERVQVITYGRVLREFAA